MIVSDNPVYSLNRFVLQNVGAFVDDLIYSWLYLQR